MESREKPFVQANINLMSPPELASLLGISKKWVEAHTQERRIPGQVKVGRLWRYNREEVLKRLLSGNPFLLEK